MGEENLRRGMSHSWDGKCNIFQSHASSKNLSFHGNEYQSSCFLRIIKCCICKFLKWNESLWKICPSFHRITYPKHYSRFSMVLSIAKRYFFNLNLFLKISWKHSITINPAGIVGPGCQASETLPLCPLDWKPFLMKCFILVMTDSFQDETIKYRWDIMKFSASKAYLSDENQISMSFLIILYLSSNRKSNTSLEFSFGSFTALQDGSIS